MLTVYRKKYYGGYDDELGVYDNLTQLYNHFFAIHRIYRLEGLFSHNPCEFYIKHFKYYRADEGIYTSVAPIYCMVIENEQGIRYSRDYLFGMFNKIQKARSRHQIRYYFYGYKRHSRGTYYRHPKTTQERRMSVNVLIDEGEPVWRASRNLHNLSHSWDDVYHADCYNDNWKRYRKQQWKPHSK